MMRWLRRLMWLGVLAGGGYAGYRTWSRKQSLGSAPPEWPPLSPSSSKPAPSSPPRSATVEANLETVGTPRWLPPVDGGCPPGYPLKVNENSGIFHVPEDVSTTAPLPSAATPTLKTQSLTATVRPRLERRVNEGRC